MWFADALVGQADQAHGIVLAGLGPQIDAAQVDARHPLGYDGGYCLCVGGGLRIVAVPSSPMQTA